MSVKEEEEAEEEEEVVVESRLILAGLSIPEQGFDPKKNNGTARWTLDHTKKAPSHSLVRKQVNG